MVDEVKARTGQMASHGKYGIALVVDEVKAKKKVFLKGHCMVLKCLRKKLADILLWQLYFLLCDEM